MHLIVLEKNIEDNNLDSSIDVRLGNGFDVLKKNECVDTAIIAGMGAHTIVGILKNNLAKLNGIETLIIASNNHYYFLRKELVRLNYYILDESIIKDGKKYYVIIKFKKGKRRYTKKELYFGPILLKYNSKVFNEYKDIEYQKLCVLEKLIPKNKIYDRYKILRELRLYK